MEPTKSALANLILNSFLVIIGITLITIRVKNITIEVLRKREKRKYEKQRERKLFIDDLK
ncbi:MAG: hypothetical protein JHC31_03875 [Sulfurihydrogenibium sp.]|jgi:hypothetical protein|nr:hypothetical protein [Sulfurihydrogenibium sp.]